MKEISAQRLLELVNKLATEEFAKWADEVTPHCPQWRVIRGAGFNQSKMKDFGTIAYLFIAEHLREESEKP